MNAQESRAALAAARADVLAALEKGKSLSHAELVELRQIVQDAIAGYEALLAAEPGNRDELEHTLGRQVIDLRRQAALLPQLESSGRPVPLSPDRVVGGQPFIETRAPPSWSSPSGSRTGTDKKRKSPGDEVDAWCGPCNGLRTHNIVAMVGDDPKQVVCQSCNARHGFRLTPARTKSEDGPRPMRGVMVKRRKTPEEQAEERRAGELAALRDELAAITTVISFDPKRRYKAGEVIEHPEYGRGRVETAMKSTILVRFGTGGRRSLILR